MMADRLTLLSFLASVVLHLAILLLLPGFGELKPHLEPEWVEVDLLPDMDADRIKIEPQKGNTARPPGSSQPGEERLGDSPLFPAPPMDMPSRLTEFNLEIPVQSVPLPGDIVPDVAGEGSASHGNPEGKIVSVLDEGLVDSGEPPEIPWHPPDTSPVNVVNVQPAQEYAIEGPVAKRKVIYKPAPPQLVVNESGTIRLKFWVHPDGTVGKIVPIIRGNPELERAAIAFLEQWRFQPLTGQAKDQWGILPIRFKVK